MKKSLDELAEMVEGEISGDGDTPIEGVGAIESAEQGQITFLSNGKYRDKLQETNASAVVLSDEEESPATLPAILVDNPDLAVAEIAHLFRDESSVSPGVHDTACVSEQAEIGEEVCIQPHVTIEDGAKIGDRSVIMAGSYIGRDVSIGSDCHIHANVNVMRETSIGDQVIIHSSSVIGSEGFGYVKDGGERKKIPQLGHVVIEDRVEIGACVTIDRARFDETKICEGAKIDNLVQIAHNVRVGRNAVIVSQTGIAGSSTIGEESMLGGQTGIADHINVGKRVQVAGGSGVTKDIEDGEVVSGFPAQPRLKFNRKQILIRKLPDLVDDLSELKDTVERLSNELEDHESESTDDSRDC